MNRERDTDLEFLRSKEMPITNSSSAKKIAIVDLFAGCGGLTLGAIEGARRSNRGAEVRLAVDVELEPLTVYKQTLGLADGVVRLADLGAALSAPFASVTRKEREFLKPAQGASLLVAGPPCQGHSALNNHTRHDDPRNDLYLKVARAARILQPDAVVVENVSGVGSDRRTAVSRCERALRRLGYSVTSKRFNLHRIGVAQSRVRHVLVASSRDDFAWEDPPRVGERSVAWAIRDLLDVSPRTVFDSASTPNATNQQRIDWLFENDEYDLPNSRRPSCHKDDHSYVSMYGRLKWREPAQTITSGFGSMGQGRFVHPLRRRTITPHEAARIQFLPDYMRFEKVEGRGKLAKMIGNAAPPALTATIVESLIAQNVI